MTSTVEFLRHILPEEGWRCGVVLKDDGKRSQRFFKTNEELAAFCVAQSKPGQHAYHAIATFKTTANRKQENVLALKCFPLDVDVGDSKPYHTTAEASAALTDFIAAAGLPEMLEIGSGSGGIHAYIVLEDAVSPEVWKPRAMAYKALCIELGFKPDPTRTADSSSVLRPPGTINYKHGLVRPVTVLRWAAPAALIDLPFKSLKKINLDLHRPGKTVLKQVEHSRLIDGAAAYSEIPSDADKVAAGCAQIGHVRDVKGDVPYDFWLYALWTLHFCTDGDNVGHAWSIGHLRYSFEETQGKLDQATSPIKCETFAGLSPECAARCQACPWRGKITTPLQIGRMTHAQEAPRHGEAGDAGEADPHSETEELNGVESASSFINDAHGLCFRTENKKGEPQSILISSSPIHLVNINRGERGERDFSLNFSIKRKFDTLQVEIPTGVFFSPRGMPEMHRHGAVIHDYDLMRKYVRTAMDTYNKQQQAAVRFDQFGWKDDDTSFLFGNHLYKEGAIITAAGNPEINRRSRMLGPRGGSLQAWSAAANSLFAEGCEPHSFALCCAFGAPLMRFHSESEGGAIVNLVSEASSTGKSTALEAVASVWGELDGVRLTDEDTRVSRGILLGTLGNLPCVFDELYKRDPDVIRQFVITFTNGRDKLRATGEGTLRAPAGDWQTILVLGSNQSIVDIMHAKNEEEAQAFRVLEFGCEQNFGGADGDKLRRELKVNAGHAGDAYLKYLLQPGMLTTVKKELEDATTSFRTDPKYGFHRQHRYWVRALACAHVAGRIVNKLGILAFSATRVINWAAEHCKARAADEHTGRRDYAHVLNEAIYALYGAILVTDSEWKPQAACQVLVAPVPTKGFFARRVRENGRLWVSRTWLNKWLVEHAINRTSFRQDLIKRGIIKNDSKFVTLGAGTPHNVGGQILTYEIDMHHANMMDALLAQEDMLPRAVIEEKPLADILKFRRPKPSAFPSPPPSSE